ncbi:flippase-like domain-containing protein [Sphingobacterium arenae]|uniref:Flippase-like domain-containing protein n=1 Tax=Sphingobacterium arenae TaxID=1280598 RepID=A0ABR7Y226_9SPHI|nr:flippase-like domain-containing protein [Sphingobacterium arenae]MBD1425326.1 flippase-like domain-containing protein [Sphingobacterium arenae]
MYRKGFRILILASIVVPIAIFVLQVDFALVWEGLRRIGSGFFVILLVTFVAYTLGTMGWWICLGSERSSISLWQLFGIRQVGETVALYNPSSVVGGDMLKNELLKSYSIPNDRALESVVASRVTALLSQQLLLAVSLCWLATITTSLHDFARYGIALLIGLLLLFKIFFFYLLNRKRNQMLPNLEDSSTIWQRFRRILYKLTTQTQYFFQYKKKLFWWSYFFFFLHWVVGGLEFYLILRFLNYDIELMDSVWMDMGVILFKSVGAFIPGQLGIEELGNKLLLTTISIQAASVWVTVSILRRARQLCWIIVGAICYIFIRKIDSFKILRDGNTVR